MTQRFTATLGIRPQEGRALLMLYVASFFLGGALLFFYTASNAIFLTAFETAALPYMYCAAFSQAGGSEEMYSLIEKITILRSVNIFSQTPEPVLREVATILEYGSARAGENLIEENSPGYRMYIIIEGKVRVHQGGVTRSHLGNRDIVGELAVLDPAPRSATVTAEEDTTYFSLDGSALAELMQVQPEINQGIIKVLVNRVRNKEGMYE